MPIYYTRNRAFPRALQMGANAYGRRPSAADIDQPPEATPGSSGVNPEYENQPDDDADAVYSEPGSSPAPIQTVTNEGAPRSGGVWISPEQVGVHKTSEAAAVFLGIPFMLWLAMQKDLPPWARWGAFAFAAGTLYVDGGLLHTWKLKEKGEAGLWGGR